MKKIVIVLGLAVAVMASFAFTNRVTYSVDVEQSKLNWVGKKITYDHKGTINLRSGKLDVARGINGCRQQRNRR